MRKAFTMIELVFVIVVIGILAAVIIPNTKTNPVQEAAIQLASDIRYTQHLAMVDDKYDANETDWEKGRWQMVFAFTGAAIGFPGTPGASYTIFSDSSTYGGDASFGEIAKNPQNSDQILTGGHTGNANLTVTDDDFVGTKKLNLGLSYGIIGISRTGGCNNMFHLTFDSFGRPLTGTHTAGTNTHQLITSDCILTLTDGQDVATLTIRPETGYVSIN